MPKAENRELAIREALMSGNMSNAIRNSEKRGQAALVASEHLPIEIYGTDRADFEALGFTFGEAIDELFVEATLPDGWQKVPSDHDMWSYIEDAEGRRRVAVFYKAAFYDRRAFMRLHEEEAG